MIKSEELNSRIRQAIGNQSVNSFADKCGISESLLRKYMTGSCPSLEKATIIAQAAGVDLTWLATGEGQPIKKEIQTGIEPPLPSPSKTADQGKEIPDDNLGFGECAELLNKIFNSGNQVLIRAIAANLHAFSEAIDNKALAVHTVNLMEQMNDRVMALEKRLKELEAAPKKAANG